MILEVEIPPASPRLKGLGYKHNPFAWLEAEKIAPISLLNEDLYVAFPGYDKIILDLDRNAILLAPRGGGKTAGRMRLAAHLESTANQAMVIQHTYFENIENEYPDIRLFHHRSYILASLSEGILNYISEHKEKFLDLLVKDRIWIWSVIHQFWRRTSLDFFIQNVDLDNDRKKLKSQMGDPFPVDSPLESVLEDVLIFFNASLNVPKLYILIDGVDGYLVSHNIDVAAAIIAPFLKSLPLLSLPGMIWKFFLPSEVANEVLATSGVQTKRIRTLKIVWDINSLVDLLKLRLSWASEGANTELAMISEPKLVNEYLKKGMELEEDLARFALHDPFGPPRALLDLADRLFELSERGHLTKTEWDNFLEDQEFLIEKSNLSESINPESYLKQNKKKFSAVLLKACPSISDLKIMAGQFYGENIEHITGNVSALIIVHELILHAEKGERLVDLLEASHKYNPTSMELKAFRQQCYGIE